MRIPSLDAVLPAGSVVTDVVVRTGGSRGSVYEVRRAGAEPLIVKRYADEWRWLQAKEVHVYALLPGAPMSETPPADIGAAYRRMGELLARLHRIEMPAFGYLTTEIVDPRPDNPSYLRGQFDRHLATFAEHGGPADLPGAIRDWVAAAAGPLAACVRPVLCHNDFHEGNVLVDEAGVVTGFVDVENAIAADPVLDLAKTVQYDRDRSADKRAALLEGYGPLPPDAHARLELYRLFHSLELWAFFAATGNTGPLPSIAADLRALVT